jgi:hypothetical protein
MLLLAVTDVEGAAVCDCALSLSLSLYVAILPARYCDLHCVTLQGTIALGLRDRLDGGQGRQEALLLELTHQEFSIATSLSDAM